MILPANFLDGAQAFLIRLAPPKSQVVIRLEK
jgi:hypothetical protein